MTDLYPDIEPNALYELAVDGGHRLYVEESGNRQGIPVVFIHGGPGAGCGPFHRRFFDPERYRIILFDQRGCGRSTPHAGLDANTTWDLVADMERIREHLGVERWLLFGGSWGSTLALAYAQMHPGMVMGMILRGIFFCREQEIEWFYQRGASRIFADYWQDFLAPIPESERGELLHAYHRRLTGENEIARMAAAKAWAIWEGRAATLIESETTVAHFGDPRRARALAMIECHYFMNRAFLKPNQLLDGMEKVLGIPGVIIQGRYDLICPMESAWELHQQWPGSELKIVADAGHAASEPGIIKALVSATDQFAMELE
ncbi:MAG: prolyl aminopeptidase [Gammaproteobacteria bacterium]|nr:prolyl aminopeptidase [Gammaproteobacteria bacterium]